MVEPTKQVTSLDSLFLVHRDALLHIIKRVKECGRPPVAVTRAGALQALRIASSPYGRDTAGVGDVVSMKLESLSVPEVGHHGVAISNLMGGSSATLLQDPKNWGVVCDGRGV